jgi:ribosomal protein S18 acetylase RimI-like enzyme
MIRYSDTIDGISPEQLEGFFVGWPDPPTSRTHLEILRGSSHIVLAIDEETGAVVGFINAVSDGVLAAYIPLLEVRPEYRGQGIGSKLVSRMEESLAGLYMVDVVCDQELEGFYSHFGMKPGHAMMLRRYDRQSGSTPEAD